MKNGKIILLSSLFCLLFINHPVIAQSQSKEGLGNSLAKCIVNEDLDSFRALLLPREAVLAFYENNELEEVEEEERDSLLTEYEETYETMEVPRLEQNFWDMVQLNKSNQIDWSTLNFVVLYKYESRVEAYDPFLIHTRLVGPVYKHFYFSAVRYKDEWFLEGKMEITKNEKYAPRD